MTTVRFGFSIILVGAALAVIAASMVSIPFGVLVASACLVALGTAVLRGSKR